MTVPILFGMGIVCGLAGVGGKSVGWGDSVAWLGERAAICQKKRFVREARHQASRKAESLSQKRVVPREGGAENRPIGLTGKSQNQTPKPSRR